MKYLCQESPIADAFTNPPYLPWPVYAYGPYGFAWERLIGRNTNLMGYPFPEGTRAVSYLISLFSFFSTLASQHLF